VLLNQPRRDAGLFFCPPEQHITSSGNQSRLRLNCLNCSFFWIKATSSYLRDIFAEAVDQDFLVKDPARKVTVPTQLRETDRTTLTWPQLRGALSKLELRDRILLELDMTECTPSWRVVRNSLGVFQPRRMHHEACGNRIQRQNPPLGQDSKELERRPRSERTGRRPVALQAYVPQFVSGAFIFPNKKGGFMDSNNYRKRVLHRLERELELPKLTFQVIRRTIATLATEEGDSEGHSRRAQTLPHRNDS
jgi:hypothetical protein